MNGAATLHVADAAELLRALAQGCVRIGVCGPIEDLPAITLSPGQSLVGLSPDASLGFVEDGLRLTADNLVADMALHCPPTAIAIGITPGARDCRTATLVNCRVRGVVQLVFEDAAGNVSVTAKALTINDADASAILPRPQGNGVTVMQGVFTLWNRAFGKSTITLDVAGLEIGNCDHPVRGSGVFVSGQAEKGGGQVAFRKFATGSVHADSTIPSGTTGTVAGGVFFLTGVTGGDVVTQGDIVTHGANAVPVDNWGTLDSWTIEGDARSFGPSAVGMVNAGKLGRCVIAGAIETCGAGARGCCIYGPVDQLAAGAIRTHGDAAIGVQILDRLGTLDVAGGIVTSGDAGSGLVKGEMVFMPAHGIEIETDGWLDVINVSAISAQGSQAVAIRASSRAIDHLTAQRR